MFMIKLLKSILTIRALLAPRLWFFFGSKLLGPLPSAIARRKRSIGHFSSRVKNDCKHFNQIFLPEPANTMLRQILVYQNFNIMHIGSDI